MGRPQFGCVQENHIWHDSPLRMRRRKAKEITQVAENPDSIKDLMLNPLLIQRELNNRSLFEFFKYFWDVISAEELVANWHIEYLCAELQEELERVGNGEKCLNDVLINIPPGTSKTTIISIMLPVWCWTRWSWMRLITASYSASLSLESAETARDLIRSEKFMQMYPELQIKADKDTKSNYRIMKVVKKKDGTEELIRGGNRFSTSVGGSLTGYHGHVLIVDDPLNPYEATSKQILHTTNHWIDAVLSTRKVDKDNTLTVILMQRLHQNDPSGHWLAKKKTKLKHICLPGDIREDKSKLAPPELEKYYKDGLLDPIRLSDTALKQLLVDLGTFQYAGQIGQNPVPPGGGMFKVDQLQIIDNMPLPHEIDSIVRYWDKAGSADTGAYTVGCKLAKLKNGKFLVIDVRRGQYGSDDRERLIKNTAEADGRGVKIGMEQEPGSGGKESAEATVRNLAGWHVIKDRPVGDKVFRADPLSVQVNYGNVMMIRADWNDEYVNEFRFFPLSKYKDQVDATSGAFAMLTGKRKAKTA